MLFKRHWRRLGCLKEKSFLIMFPILFIPSFPSFCSCTHMVTDVLQTYTGAPPGAKLVQCEIKWVIRILHEVRRDQIPFNVPVHNIWITIQHTCFKALPLQLHWLGGLAGLICLVCFYVGCRIWSTMSSDGLICCWLHFFFIKTQRKTLNIWMIIIAFSTHRAGACIGWLFCVKLDHNKQRFGQFVFIGS